MEGNNALFRGRSDRTFDAINTLLIVLLLLAVAYPLYFLMIASISNPAAVGTGKVYLIPDAFNLEGYKRIFEYSEIWLGYRNSFLYAACGSILSVTVTVCCGYAFTQRALPFRRILFTFFIIPMFFSGGLIPTYLQVSSLGLLNKPVVLIVMGCVSAYNIIIARTFIDSTIPMELREAALIDGCNNLRYLVSIVVPLSKALIAVLFVFAIVAQWNSYFNALIYMNRRDWIPLQLVLRQILSNNNFAMMQNLDVGLIGEDAALAAMRAESMKYGLFIVSSLPVLILYPFAQKYFVKGVMIGSVKG